MLKKKTVWLLRINMQNNKLLAWVNAAFYHLEPAG